MKYRFAFILALAASSVFAGTGFAQVLKLDFNNPLDVVHEQRENKSLYDKLAFIRAELGYSKLNPVCSARDYQIPQNWTIVQSRGGIPPTLNHFLILPKRGRDNDALTIGIVQMNPAGNITVDRMNEHKQSVHVGGGSDHFTEWLWKPIPRFSSSRATPFPNVIPDPVSIAGQTANTVISANDRANPQDDTWNGFIQSRLVKTSLPADAITRCRTVKFACPCVSNKAIGK